MATLRQALDVVVRWLEEDRERRYLGLLDVIDAGNIHWNAHRTMRPEVQRGVDEGHIEIEEATGEHYLHLTADGNRYLRSVPTTSAIRQMERSVNGD